MKQLNTIITDFQDEWLAENSSNRSQASKGMGLSKAEHVRKALDNYIERHKKK